MAAPTEWDLLSHDAQEALQEFEIEYIATLTGVAEAWARRLGGYRRSRMKVTWPIALSAAGYKPFEGDVKYRSLAAKSFEIIPRTWQDGVAELASVVEAPDFIGWNSEPTRMALDGVRAPNRWVTALLEANGTCWDGKAFFATDHPANVLKTPPSGTTSFANLHTSAEVTKSYLKLMKRYHSTVPDALGGSLGTRLTAVLCRPDEEQDWLDLRDSSLVVEPVTQGGLNVAAAAVDNRHRGTFEVIVAVEPSDAAFYGISGNIPGLVPWVVIDDGTPETFVNDRTSPLYKTALKIGFASILRGYAGLAMPQAIHRYEL